MINATKLTTLRRGFTLRQHMTASAAEFRATADRLAQRDTSFYGDISPRYRKLLHAYERDLAAGIERHLRAAETTEMALDVLALDPEMGAAGGARLDAEAAALAASTGAR